MALLLLENPPPPNPPSDGPFVIVFGRNKRSIITFHLEHYNDMLGWISDFIRLGFPYEAYYSQNNEDLPQ